MINEVLKNAVIKKNFVPKGLCSLVQNAKKEDIVFLNVTNTERIDSLLQNSLRDDFEGLIIATSLTDEIKKHNYLIVNDSEFDSVQKKLTDSFYPEVKSKYFGVTGTNGKTTTCWLLSEVGMLNGLDVLYIGTIGIFYNGQKISNNFVTTTPTLLDLRKTMSLVNKNIDVVSLEISSHALQQGRLKGLKLDGAAWTNLTQDHLDYHKSMDEYFEAKSKIIKMIQSKGSLYINPGHESLSSKIKFERKVIVSKINDKASLPLFFKSSFNKENLAIACALLNVSVPGDLSLIKQPPGRFEFLSVGNNDFIIDYAHTPDALVNVLKEIKKNYSDRYLVTVIGCGGDRDRSKRPLMGDAARKYSDLSIFTSDNPRSESPGEIIKQMITPGEENYLVEEDREMAIKKALEVVLEKGLRAIVLIAGKGHENYQELMGKRKHFSDREVVKGL